MIVLALGEKANIADEAKRLKPLVEQAADVVLFDLEFSADLSKVEADMAIVMGGDGSILRARQSDGLSPDTNPRGQLGEIRFSGGGRSNVVVVNIDARLQRRPRRGTDRAAGGSGPPVAASPDAASPRPRTSHQHPAESPGP